MLSPQSGRLHLPIVLATPLASASSAPSRGCAPKAIAGHARARHRGMPALVFLGYLLTSLAAGSPCAGQTRKTPPDELSPVGASLAPDSTYITLSTEMVPCLPNAPCRKIATIMSTGVVRIHILKFNADSYDTVLTRGREETLRVFNELIKVGFLDMPDRFGPYELVWAGDRLSLRDNTLGCSIGLQTTLSLRLGKYEKKISWGGAGFLVPPGLGSILHQIELWTSIR